MTIDSDNKNYTLNPLLSQGDTFESESFTKIRSSVSSQLMRSTLFRGTFIAALGMLLMAYTGTVLPLNTLTSFGIVFYAIGCGLITLGLLPYRKLCSLEKCPHELCISNLGKITYFTKRRRVFSLSLDSISAVSFADSPSNYGIIIDLKDPIPEKVIIYDTVFSSLYRQDKHGKGQLFLPYFSKKSCELLSEALNNGENQGT